MKQFTLIIAVFIFLNSICYSQCLPGKYTYTINGLYTSDLNVTNGDTVYIAPTATVTGNIKVYNSRIANCGTILNSKIYLRGNYPDVNGKLENAGTIKTDSTIVDSTGDLHNYSIYETKYTYIGPNGNIDNLDHYTSINIYLDQNWFLFNGGHLFVTNNTKLKKGRILNYYMIHIKDTLYVDSASSVANGCTIYIDSALINKGNYGCATLPNKNPTTLIIGRSENYVTINCNDICDATSLTGGFDLNTGTLNGVTYCQNPITCPDYTMIGLKNYEEKENDLKVFPNPASNQISISGLNETENYSVEIKNLFGQSVLKTTQNKNINIEELVNGVYFVGINQKEKPVKSLKFIK